jgi:hypothetical protein
VSEARKIVNRLVEGEAKDFILGTRQNLRRYRFGIGGEGPDSPLSLCFTVHAFDEERAVKLANQILQTKMFEDSDLDLGPDAEARLYFDKTFEVATGHITSY